MTTACVRLGGQDYRVLPLTLGQLRRILPAFSRAATALSSGALNDAAMEALIDILHEALSRANPEMTRERLLGIEATLEELAAAQTMIAELSGLIRPGEAVAGNL
jgi:hypothetical protein